MNTQEDDYGIFAAYYDECYGNRPELSDLAFWLELADTIGGPVLEIACGTGRVALEVARRGHEVHGLEFSPAMLGIFANKIAGTELADRVTLTTGDMRDFDLDRTFPLITIPFRPFQHMYTQEDQLRALACARKHLAPGGRLVLDVFHPRYDLLLAGIGEEKQDTEWIVPDDPALTRRRFFRKEWVDTTRNQFAGKFCIRTYDGDTMVREDIEELKMCWFSYMQMQLLFELAGFHVVEEYGSFEKTPIHDDPSDMIFVVEAAEGAQ